MINVSHAAQQQDPSNLQDQEVRAAATRDNAAPQEAPRARRLNRERARQVLGGHHDARGTRNAVSVHGARPASIHV